MRRLRLLSLLFLALLALPPPSSAEFDLGVYGGIGRFRELTGQRSDSRLYFFAFRQSRPPGWYRYFNATLRVMGPRPIVAFGTTNHGRVVLTPRGIARGKGDGFLATLNRELASRPGREYLRPLAEMNGHWNPYCAYNENGTRRGPSHSTRVFRQAFRRIYLIAHGARNINRRLRALHLPPVRRRLVHNPAPQLKVIWNPQGSGSPDVPGNSARAYFPGARYVDVVGNDLYQIGGRAAWDDARALYRAHPRKPYAFPEWGLWNDDDPSFVRRMARFVRTHRRTVLIAYYNGGRGSIFDLGSKPRARAAYRRYIVPLGR